MKYTIEFQYENNVAVVRFENDRNCVTALEGLTKESLEEFIKKSYQEILDTDKQEQEKQERIKQLKESVKNLEVNVAKKEFDIDGNKEIKEVKKVNVVLEPV